MKVFLFDADKCNGCMNCQFACKDEHCGNDWGDYAAPQPNTGQFWLKLEEKVRGSFPKVRVSWLPRIGGQNDNLAKAAGGAAMKRDDGLVVLVPERCKGRRDLADSFEGVYWNEDLQIPQACNGCAHLLDDGWKVPRCVESCGLGALRFGDEEEFADELKDAVQLEEGSHVYYLNLPKRFVAGTVVDLSINEVVIGATITLENKETGELRAIRTDEFGDFWFKKVEAAAYNVYVEAEGYMTRKVEADTTELDVNVGVIEMTKLPLAHNVA